MNTGLLSAPSSWQRLSRQGLVMVQIFGVLVLSLLKPGVAQAWQTPGEPLAGTRDGQPALGINATFGRWNTTVKMVYDPDGAPAAYADANAVLALITRAFSEWETVSGIKFSLVGIDAQAPDDDRIVGVRDGLVRFSWGETGTNAALAGPSFGSYNPDLGYYPYDDGGVIMSRRSETWSSDEFLVSTLVHELGHLLGLGHSDNPDSIMYANPYTFLNHPREDDILAIQALYGLPAVAIDPALPQAQWVYSAPPVASAGQTAAYFKANDFDSSPAHLAIGETVVTSVDAAISDTAFLLLRSGGFGDGSQRVELHAVVVAVDPFGYVFNRKKLDLVCEVNSLCGGAGVGITPGRVLKSIPGKWHIYVVDEAANRTLLGFALPVNTAVAYNQPPTGTLTVAPGTTAASARFTVTASDPESNPIQVIWHGPGIFDRNGDNIIDTDITNTINSGGSVSQSFNFSLTGVHTFYVELKDNQAPYDGSVPGSSRAGAGFQTLLRVRVVLPVTDPNTALSVVSSAGATTGADLGVSREVLNKVTDTPRQSQILATDKSTSTAEFRLGASGDQGNTLSTTFVQNDTVIIAGSAVPQLADIGKAADIFIVIRTTTGTQDRWTYRGMDGVYRDWNSKVSALEPAYAVAALLDSEAFGIYSGALVTATHKVFIGYRLQGGSVLHYTGAPLRLDVL